MQVNLPGRKPVTGTAQRTTEEATLPPAAASPARAARCARQRPGADAAHGLEQLEQVRRQRVDDAIVRSVADAMVACGMSKAGYKYINIDDTWEGPRDRNGNITCNRKFPDMKALADYVHSKGLKIGIYSAPARRPARATQAASATRSRTPRPTPPGAFDYLKYDWCSAGRIYKDSEMRAVYQKMGDALLTVTGRPIVYSLCQYGLDDVWKWGAKVGGNLWRTTGDINDNWERMDEIGFSQFGIANYIAARPLERSRHAGDRQRRHDRRRVPDPHEPVVPAGRAAAGRQRSELHDG